MTHDEAMLFDRAVCHDATDAHWEALERLAARDPLLWQRLASALRDHGDVAKAMNFVAERADAVELDPRRRWGSWGSTGWAVAAGVLIWIGLPRHVPDAMSSDVPSIEQVGELPSVLVGAKELPGGAGVEVTYVRRLVERRTTPALLEPAENEWGEPTVRPVDLSNAMIQEL